MKKIPIIYITGSGHCGSTLLDLILDCHSKIVGIGELYQWLEAKKNTRELVCTCGEKAFKCNFWQKVFSKTNKKFNFKVYRNKKNFLLNKKRFFEFDEVNNKKQKLIDIKNYLKVNEKIYENILAVSGKKIIVDSSKDPDRLELLLGSDRLDITILHLARDGKAVTWSYKKKYKGISQPVGIYGRWFFKNLKIELIKKRNKATNVFIQYENFCQNPEKYLKIILSKVKLPFESKMLTFRNCTHHQIGGNRLRFSKEEEIKIDRTWRKEMLILDKFKFNLFFGWLNLIYKIKKSRK